MKRFLRRAASLLRAACEFYSELLKDLFFTLSKGAKRLLARCSAKPRYALALAVVIVAGAIVSEALSKWTGAIAASLLSAILVAALEAGEG